MKVKCSQCGKEFEAPDSQANRMIRCTCRNIFRVQPVGESSNNAETAPSELPVYSMPEEISEDSLINEPTISDSELDDYLSHLKNSREKNSKNDQTEVIAARTEIIPIDIEIDTQTQPQIHARATEIAPKEIQAELIQKSQARAPQRPRPERYNEAPDPFHKTIFQRLNRPQWTLLSGVLVLLAVGLTMLIFKSFEKKEEVQDPYLTKLLTPSPEPQKAAAPDSTPAPKLETVAVPQPEPKTVQAANESSKTQAKNSQTPSEKKRYEKMFTAALNGDFENVIRLGSVQSRLSSSELGLFYDALILRAGSNSSRLKEIQLDLIKTTRSNSSSALARSTALLITQSSSSDSSDLIKALEMFKNLQLTRHDDPLVYSYTGLVYEKLHRTDLAHKIWDQSLQSAPHYVWLIEKRIQMYRAVKDYKNAAEMARRLSRLKGHEYEGTVLLGELSKLQDNPSTAAKYYQDAARLKDSPEARLSAGIVLAEKNPLKAIKQYEAGLGLSPSSKTKRDLLYRLGKSYCDAKEFKQASASFQKALHAGQPSFDIYYSKGLCELEGGAPLQASLSLEAALKLNTKNDKAWLQYGIALLKTNKQRAALGALNRSLDIRETDAAHYYLAVVLIQLNRKEEASIHAKKAYKMNPKHHEARKILSQLSPH